MTATLTSGSAPLPSLSQPRPRAPRLIPGSAPTPSKPHTSPPVALPRLRICAPTRSQVRTDGGKSLRVGEMREVLSRAGSSQSAAGSSVEIPAPGACRDDLTLALTLTLTLTQI